MASGWISLAGVTAPYPTANFPAANVIGLAPAATGGNVACATGTFAGNVVVSNLFANAVLVPAATVLNAVGTLVVTGNVTVNGATFAGLAPFRNRVHNGAFTVNQRQILSAAAGATGNAYTLNASAYFLDRWAAASSGASTLALNFLQVALTSSDAPLLAGLPCGLRATAGTAGSTTAYVVPFQHGFEGYNVADLAWGTNGAQPVSLSFWMRASTASALVSVALSNAGGTQSYVTTVTASSTAGGWTYCTVPIVGCTSGTWFTAATAASACMWLRLGAVGTGTYSTATLGSWQGSNVFAATAAVTNWNWITISGAYLEFAGVQLEAGAIATPFDVRPYPVELALCQRYFFQISYPTGTSWPYPLSQSGYVSSTNTNNGYMFFTFPVPMRVAPTTFAWSNSSGAVTGFNVSTGASAQAMTMASASTFQATLYVTSLSTSLALCANWVLTTQSTSSGTLAWSADL